MNNSRPTEEGQTLRIIEPSYQERRFREKTEAFIKACKEIETLWKSTGHTSPSPLYDLAYSFLSMTMFASEIPASTSKEKINHAEF